jgi:uncharacterized protein YoxC
MPPQTLASKVEELQTRVTRLEELPARIDDLTSQVSQLRVEMRDEFSAVRSDIGGLQVKTDGLASQMRVLHEDVIARIALLQEGWPKPPKRTRKKT